jgi:hypothetical protein
MTVVMELDKTLFEGYIKSKGDTVTTIIRGGILDHNMDWYETPQPTGMFSGSRCSNYLNMVIYRNSSLHV